MVFVQKSENRAESLHFQRLKEILNTVCCRTPLCDSFSFIFITLYNVGTVKELIANEIYRKKMD